MAAVTGYALVRSREGRRGRLPLLDDPSFRARLIALAGAGISRRGVARLAGIAPARLGDWLARGKAHENEEPWGSFAVDYLAAERVPESVAVTIQSRRLAYLAQLPPAALTPADMRFVEDYLVSRYPAEHGTSAQHRQPDGDPDADAWLQQTGMVHAQLVHMFTHDPPEELDAAMLEASDAIVARFLNAGWKPSEALCGVVLARRNQAADEDDKP